MRLTHALLLLSLLLAVPILVPGAAAEGAAPPGPGTAEVDALLDPTKPGHPCRPYCAAG